MNARSQLKDDGLLMLMSLSVNARQTHQTSLFLSRSFTRWAESWFLEQLIQHCTLEVRSR